MDEMEAFFKSEIKKIEIDKWDEGMRRHSDPGNEYVLEWVEKNAPWFRESWNNSCCRDCVNCIDCGYNIRTECDGLTKGI